MKKNILFFTFLSIFILTAIITLLGILELIKIKSGYLNTLVGVFVIELAGAVITLFRKADFFSDDVTPNKVNKNTNKMEPAPPACDTATTPPESNLVASEYFETFHDLKDRFHEQEEFVKRHNGHRVCWSGIVNSVSTQSDCVCIQLKTSENMIYDIIHVNLPMDLRTKAYALHKGDIIAATGTLNTLFMPMAPLIDNATFELKQKAASNNVIIAS